MLRVDGTLIQPSLVQTKEYKPKLKRLRYKKNTGIYWRKKKKERKDIRGYKRLGRRVEGDRFGLGGAMGGVGEGRGPNVKMNFFLFSDEVAINSPFATTGRRLN